MNGLPLLGLGKSDGKSNTDLTAGAAGASAAIGGPSFVQILASATTTTTSSSTAIESNSDCQAANKIPTKFQLVEAAINKAAADGKITPDQQKTFLAEVKDMEKLDKGHHKHHRHHHVHSESDVDAQTQDPFATIPADASTAFADSDMTEKEQAHLDHFIKTFDVAQTQGSLSSTQISSIQSFLATESTYVSMLKNLQSAILGQATSGTTNGSSSDLVTADPVTPVSTASTSLGA